MRNALLLAIAGLATITTLGSLGGCGDASSSTGIQRTRGPAVPAEGSQQVDDPNVNEPSDPANPNATTPPKAPTTPGTAAGELGVTLSTATPQSDLGTKLDITVTVAPKAGFKGDAVLSVTGLPAGATAAFVPASVTLNTTPVTSKMTVTIPVTAAPSVAGTPMIVTAKSGTITATANANFKVNPKLTMTIPVNVAAMLAAGGTKYVDDWAGPALGTAPSPLQTQTGNNIQVFVINKDSSPRIVHGNAGFIHGDTANPIPPGGTDPKVRTLAPGVTTSGYLHGETNNTGTSLSFRVSVQAAP